MSTSVPWFVAEKRARKASRIATALSARGTSVDAAVRLDDDQRREVEVAAGVKSRGSDRTWRSAINMLAGSHAPSAWCLTCGIGDPEGVDGPRKPYGHPGPCAR